LCCTLYLHILWIDETRQNHTVLRELAVQQVQRNMDLMKNLVDNKNKKRRLVFDIGDCVRINIPRIDRTSVDRRSLPCKVLEVLDGGLYRLGCAHGILENCYQVCEMESVSATFTELTNIPNNRILLTQAARLQSSATVQRSVCCCKSNCNTNRCPCKRSGVGCGSRCHPSQSKCINRE